MQLASHERDHLEEDIEHLVAFPQAATASDLGMTERGWRKITMTRPKSRGTMVIGVRALAAAYWLCQP